MKKFYVAALLVGLIAVAGCRTKSGSREYLPGKGWKEIRLEQPQPQT